MANKCRCWAALKRRVKGACSSSSSTESPNAIPRTSLIYNAATETRYLNASNKELAVPQDAQASTDVVIDLPGPKKKDVPQLLQFTFQELKYATVNFRPDSIF